MATKKTNNKKEEISKKTSAVKKSAVKEQTSKSKESLTSKKKVASSIKKTERKSSAKKISESKIAKKSADNSLNKKSYRANTIRKIEPIKTDNIEKKPERESIKLLREAIKAKSKTVSKPVAVKKHLIVKDDDEDNVNETAKNPSVSSVIKKDTENIQKADFIFNKLDKEEEANKEITETTEEKNLEEKKSEKEKIEKEKSEEKKSEVKSFTKNTYSKSDIFKKHVVKNPVEYEELKRNIEKSKFNQSEIDDAIENAAMIEEDTPVEDYSKYSSKKLEELKKKDIKIIETEDEMKDSGIPEIERKPAAPYVAPPHSSVKKEKKSNKLVAIIGIIIIILGLSYLGFQFFGNKDDSLEDGFYNLETNEIETNDMISPITNSADIEEIDGITNETFSTSEIDTVTIEQTNNENTTLQTNDITETFTNNTNNSVNTVIQSNIVSPPQPNLPNPPTVPSPPPTPTSQNTSSYLGGNTYKTKWSDTLTSIASSELGDARRWPTIYVMNEDIFPDPDSLVFNKNIRLPEGGKRNVGEMNSEEKRALYNDYMRVSQVYLNMGKTNLANVMKNRAESIIR